MIAFYQLIFLKPIFNSLIALYNFVGDMGVAIVLLTLAVRLIILPVTIRSLKSQKALQQLQPKLEELKAKFKGDRQGLAKATMELYKQEKVNPASSCLPLLVQLPIFIALYQALMVGLKNGGGDFLYSFVSKPQTLNVLAFGFLDLAKASLPIAFLAGASQFWQTAMLSQHKPKKPAPSGSKDEAMLGMMNKQMLYVMPVMTVIIGAKLPGGVILYWLITNVLTIVQQYVFLRPKPLGTSH